MAEVFSLPELVAWILYRNYEPVNYARDNSITCWELFENALLEQAGKNSAEKSHGQPKSKEPGSDKANEKPCRVILLREELLQTLKTGMLVSKGRRVGKLDFEIICPMDWRTQIETIDQYIEWIKPEDVGKHSLIEGKWRAETLYESVFVDKEEALKKWPDEASAVIETSIYHSGGPGRPSPIQFVEEEAKRRRLSGEAHKTVVEESRQLHEWCRVNHSGISAPHPKTIENRIRKEHRIWALTQTEPVDPLPPELKL
jgi:hypothetical protein